MVGQLYWVNVRLSPSPNFIMGDYKFQYFPHSLIKLGDFCVIGPSNLRATNVLWASEVKEQPRKYKKRMSHSLFQI